MSYPAWAFFPRRSPAPEWVNEFLVSIATHEDDISSATHDKMESDEVVAAIRGTLVLSGWQVEVGKRKEQKIHRPVLFGDNGTVRVKQEIDGWHPDIGIVLEVESGRGWQGNAVYRDLVRASLIADARYLVLGVRSRYKYGANDTVQNDFERTRELLDSIYASQRLGLPFEGILLFGW